MSFPYIALVFSCCILASLFRPFIVVSLGCVLSNPSAALRKGQLFVSTVTYLLFCNDKTWKEPKEDPASFFEDKDSKLIDRKTIIFIRHAESLWNETFNRGDRSLVNFALYFLPNLVKAIAFEWYFWCSGRANESWFFDSPISDKGRGQAESIQTFLQTDLSCVTPKEAELMRLLLGDKQVSAQIVSSNLRRTIATMAIGFQDRFAKKYEKDQILILPALQELSRYPDALSITPAKGQVVPCFSDPKVLTGIYKNNVDTSFHTGNKDVSSTGLKRMEEFCNNVFLDIPQKSIIAGGHSLWFQSFFRTYLPYQVDHVSKKKKLSNGGIVAFTLQRIKVDDKSYRHMIDPTSIVVLHGGFLKNLCDVY